VLCINLVSNKSVKHYHCILAFFHCHCIYSILHVSKPYCFHLQVNYNLRLRSKSKRTKSDNSYVRNSCFCEHQDRCITGKNVFIQHVSSNLDHNSHSQLMSSVSCMCRLKKQLIQHLSLLYDVHTEVFLNKLTVSQVVKCPPFM